MNAEVKPCCLVKLFIVRSRNSNNISVPKTIKENPYMKHKATQCKNKARLSIESRKMEGKDKRD